MEVELEKWIGFGLSFLATFLEKNVRKRILGGNASSFPLQSQLSIRGVQSVSMGANNVLSRT